jgi:hypothetical protein
MQLFQWPPRLRNPCLTASSAAPAEQAAPELMGCLLVKRQSLATVMAIESKVPGSRVEETDLLFEVEKCQVESALGGNISDYFRCEKRLKIGCGPG